MQIQWTNPQAVAPRLREAVEARLHALSDRVGDLMLVAIEVRPDTHHRHGAEEAVIRTWLGDRSLIAREREPEPGRALHRALDVFEREVRRARDRQVDHSHHRGSEPPTLGVIDRVFPERGYGFLITDAGESVYFHRNAVKTDFDALREGQRVALNYEMGEQGLQATVVDAPPPDVPTP